MEAQLTLGSHPWSSVVSCVQFAYTCLLDKAARTARDSTIHDVRDTKGAEPVIKKEEQDSHISGH